MADQAVQPSIGRIVIYRSRAGVDMPAIITALAVDEDSVHLHLFPPPGAAADGLSYEFGTARAEDEQDPALETWRWPGKAPSL